ncbi:MAG: hypothetical protein A3H96_25225 [Acidobacteria bacterium RIFCSPLOWO2_02_FULL_67_36]|nr:MAG: hypothetical protein A3H96_25225 [Acidobacteria bacterium RIFCSPLOWO2_02_FULL_67_36]OFW21606.1 MAG: hypothetical protein A3G21_14485 [Acidobacteria bacterium RIFCSPLOWO2_12_FULL_66_21]
MKLVVRAAVLCAAVAAAGAVLYGQRFGGGSRRAPLDVQVQGNTPYDGRFVFVRLRYNSGFGGGFRRGGGGGPMWAHDYPDGEVHLSRILQEITLLRIRTDGSNILSLDDPELFNYPVAYMAEPGFWQPSASEAESFRKYLLKGGFAIFDDFRGPHWNNLQYQMRQVLPDAQWVELDGTAQIFHSFFEIDHPEDLAPPPIYGQAEAPSYWGIYENNDPKKRLLVVANVDQDISEYWEYSGTGFVPVDVTNEAYKFGVNYVIYGLTH